MAEVGGEATGWRALAEAQLVFAHRLAEVNVALVAFCQAWDLSVLRQGANELGRALPEGEDG